MDSLPHGARSVNWLLIGFIFRISSGPLGSIVSNVSNVMILIENRLFVAKGIDSTFRCMQRIRPVAHYVSLRHCTFRNNSLGTAWLPNPFEISFDSSDRRRMHKAVLMPVCVWSACVCKEITHMHHAHITHTHTHTHTHIHTQTHTRYTHVTHTCITHSHITHTHTHYT